MIGDLNDADSFLVKSKFWLSYVTMKLTITNESTTSFT